MVQDRERVLLDVNAMAIFLVEDHPGNDYISGEIEKGFTAGRELIVMDYLPFRVHWIHTTRWGLDERESIDAIRSFLEAKVEVVGMDRRSVLNTLEIAEEKNHDIYDCFYISLARQVGASHILTTDRDFMELCEEEPFDYLNPVPDEVIAKFYVYDN